jgi:hypothetical protein
MTSPIMVILVMDAPFVSFPIPCTNYYDKQFKYKASHHTKGSCYHCNENDLQCNFLPPYSLAWISNDQSFSHSETYCLQYYTESHQQSQFGANSPLLQCKCLTVLPYLRRNLYQNIDTTDNTTIPTMVCFHLGVF